jgi:hypothetical protein
MFPTKASAQLNNSFFLRFAAATLEGIGSLRYRLRGGQGIVTKIRQQHISCVDFRWVVIAPRASSLSPEAHNETIALVSCSNTEVEVKAICFGAPSLTTSTARWQACKSKVAMYSALVRCAQSTWDDRAAGMFWLCQTRQVLGLWTTVCLLYKLVRCTHLFTCPTQCVNSFW